jgi:Domain of unknown function (DUF4386)
MACGNASATAQDILASERLFRLGVVSELICAVEFIFLLWVLYRLLGGVNKTYASLMVTLVLGFVPIMCMNVVDEIAALRLFRGADFLSVLGQPQHQAMAMLFLDLHRYGYVMGWIFGLWLFFFGLLGFPSPHLRRTADRGVFRLLWRIVLRRCFCRVTRTS